MIDTVTVVGAAASVVSIIGTGAAIVWKLSALDTKVQALVEQKLGERIAKLEGSLHAMKVSQ